MKKYIYLTLLIIFSITLYSCKKPIQKDDNIYFNVTYNTNGGSEILSDKVLENTKLEIPEEPVKDNYKFVGWYKDRRFNEKYDFETLVTRSFTLYAKWEEDVEVYYEVTYNTNGGTTVVKSVVLKDTKLEKPEEPTKAGYIFIGWYKNEGLNQVYDFNDLVNSSFILYAKWEEDIGPEVHYEVTYDTNGGSTLVKSVVLKGTKLEKPEDPIKSGHKFIGWYKNKNLTLVYNFNDLVNSSFILYAKWEKNIEPEVYYEVTYNTNGGSTLVKSVVLKDTKLEKTEEPTKSGYKFVGWYKDESLSSLYDFNELVKGNFTLHAKWIELSDDVDVGDWFE